MESLLGEQTCQWARFQAVNSRWMSILQRPNSIRTVHGQFNPSWSKWERDWPDNQRPEKGEIGPHNWRGPPRFPRDEHREEEPHCWQMKRKRDIKSRKVKKWKARLNMDGSRTTKGVHYDQTYAPRGILELNQDATHRNRAARVAHQAAGLCPSFSAGASRERPLHENSSRIRNREWQEPRICSEDPPQYIWTEANRPSMESLIGEQTCQRARFQAVKSRRMRILQRPNSIRTVHRRFNPSCSKW